MIVDIQIVMLKTTCFKMRMYLNENIIRKYLQMRYLSLKNENKVKA